MAHRAGKHLLRAIDACSPHGSPRTLHVRIGCQVHDRINRSSPVQHAIQHSGVCTVAYGGLQCSGGMKIDCLRTSPHEATRFTEAAQDSRPLS